VGENLMMVFGGFFSSTTRLNDSWILNTETLEWYQPESVISTQQSPMDKAEAKDDEDDEARYLNVSKRDYLDELGGGGDAAAAGVAPVDNNADAPTPRGAHSACLVGSHVWVFGGYGGQGFSRRDFNDAFKFSIETMAWEAVGTVSGEPPEERSGHAALATQDSMFVFGGWNATCRFNDLWCLQTDTLTWEKIEGGGFGNPRWNHASISVAAVPSWLVFVFGGIGGDAEDKDVKKGSGAYLDDVAMLTTNKRSWTKFEPSSTSSKPPKARADASMLYEPSSKRLIVFGGWSNRWLGDAYAAEAADIVGPPYAVLSVGPAIGPVTGGTRITVKGMGFTPDMPMVVRFLSGKKYAEVPATVLDSETLECTTPDMTAVGPGRTSVRVAVRGSPFTITSEPFVFFRVTSPANTLAFGPGVLTKLAHSKPVSFYIQAWDTADEARRTGGDVFKVRVTLTAPGEKVASEPLGTVEVEDMNNGLYHVKYTVPGPGTATVSVDFDGTFGAQAGPIRGSPFRVEFPTEEVDPAENEFETSSRVKEHVKTELSELVDLSKGTLSGLQTKVPEDSLDTLLAVKNNITAVGTRDAELKLRLDSCSATLMLMREHGNAKQAKEVEKLTKQLDDARTTWESCKKQMPMTRIGIAPLVKHHGAETKHAIEAYETKLGQYFQEVDSKSAYWDFKTGPDGATSSIAERREAQKQERKRLDRMLHLARTFDFPQLMEPSIELMKSIDDETNTVEQMWKIAMQMNEFESRARALLWDTVKPEELDEECKAIQKELRRVASKRARTKGVYKGLSQQIKDFLDAMPLVTDLRNPAMRPRHWAKLMTLTGKTFTPPHEDPEMKLANLLELHLHDHTNEVDEITDQALKEAKMEEGLRLLEETWATIEFLTEDHMDVKILKIGEEDFETLEAHQLLVQSMVANRYMATFKEQILGWKNALANVGDVRSLLGDIQQLWKYLEPLFMRSDEVKRELPEASELFAGGDTQVREILSKAATTKNIKEACNVPGLTKHLEELLKLLERCKKALDDFLAGKRAQFPRFYFVSDPDLLDILSNGNFPSKVLRHVTKIFLAVDNFSLEGEEAKGGERPTAAKFVSCVGIEDVSFDPPYQLSGKVEEYLQVSLDQMRVTLRKRLGSAIERRKTQSRIEWIMARRHDDMAADPAQLSLLVAGMDYTNDVEGGFDALSKGDPDGIKKIMTKTRGDLSDLIRLTRTSIKKADRTRVMCLITLDAHGRDVLEKLIRENVTDVNAFQWQSMLKQRYDDNKAVIAVSDARFPYCFEYMGNGARLVVTPLTDRIYVTATQALKLNMGCAPAGPAGTGKTETTKDLASAMGIVCYVFNCSPEHDYTSLGNIFKGLAASGSWGCFDEFNRLVPAVLSVCSVQFKAVCDGIRLKRHDVTINGETVHLEWSAGAFITMNPGYLGRSELPEGLKALFRPITVMVPDLVLICENMLMAEGFEQAKVLASKFYGLYSLLRELLSKQMHYDWGLRAVKSVLVVAGAFKRAEPDLAEQELLLRALRDFNTPKIVKQDEPIFKGLLGDLFPGLDPPRKVDEVLETAVVAACEKRGLFPDDLFRLKVVQLEELLEIRHCVFVMGPSGAGKSSCWKTLADSRRMRTSGARNTKYVDLNPKAVIPEELYGFIHPATREWKDGILSVVMRDLGNEPGTDPKWIILDGDLDANWIESMNSVMDDNRMLTLASNERIPLKSHMRMLFEIRDLNFASPATVSRAGIIYISTNTGSQWRSLVKSWLARLDASEAVRNAIRKFCLDPEDGYCDHALLHIKKECRPLVPVEDVTLVANLLRLLDCLLPPEVLAKLSDPAQTPEGEMVKTLETYFVFAAVWAFGSALSDKDGVDYRDIFSKFWRGTYKNVRLPSRDTVFDYFLDETEFQFDMWRKSSFFTSVDFDSTSMSMASVTVPTPETVSISFWMSHLVKKRIPVMLVGDSGCGKTALVNGLLRQQDPGEIVSTTLNFNFFTDSRTLQTNMEAPLEKKTSTTIGPPGTVKMIYFVDDINLPEVDPYNTQSAIALLRQHVDYGHWYDMSKLEVRNVIDCQYIACMNPTAGSFLINPRLQRHFVTFAIGFPGPTSLNVIYETFLGGHLKHFGADVQELQGTILAAAMQLQQSVMQTFRKSAQNFHYEFNIRHLSNVFQGVLMGRPSEFADPAKVVMLWLHESERVYGDRLVSYEDLSKYKALAKSQATKKFPQFNSELQNFFAEKADPLIFCHFADNILDKVYDRVRSMEKLHTTLMDALREYNESFATMALVLFEDAMRHVCRITRIINNPAGHALLVGVGGSGKQSLSRLAAYICQYSVSQIVISSTYSMNDLKDDLKKMYRIAGVKGEGLVFLFTDSQITNERFLVAMNDLLASGNIPDLFAQDEIDEIVNALVPKVKGEGLNPDAPTCWEYFLKCVRNNLHVILCFSPVGEAFRTRAKRFPALVNCTVIDWFQPWPEEALFSVGKEFLASIPDLGGDAVRARIEQFMPYSFQVVNNAAKRFQAAERRFVYTTPKSYLELLNLYKKLLGAKRKESASAIQRLSDGLDKLRETAEAVEKIEADLKISLADAEVKKATAEKIAEEVAANKAVVEEETAKANVEAAKCAEIADEVSRKQATAEENLAKAEPAVEAAAAALDSLDEKDLSSCKTMSTPPPGVDDVFIAVQVLLAKVHDRVPITKAGKVKDKDRSWDAVKKQLLQDIKGFMSVLLGYKAMVEDNKVPEINFKEVRPYLELPHFTKDAMITKNPAAAGLCDWAINIVMFHDIIVEVEPMRQALREANEKLTAANIQLKEVQDRVAELQAKLDKLQTEFDAASKEKAEAQAAVDRGQKKLDLANRLTTALADENVRWAEGVELLKAERELLTGDVLLASAFISYIGPFTKRFREQILSKELLPYLKASVDGLDGGVPMSPAADPLKILTNEAQIATWLSQGLPDDQVSKENGCIVSNTARWPLMIDPQLQGIKWITTKEEANGLKVVRQGQKTMLTNLESAISSGVPVLIENMGERIEAVLNPVISRATTKRGATRFTLQLGDKEVDYHPDFRLYLHTKLSNPHYPPEVQAEAALINFTVTEAGLEDQLLALTVLQERPDLATLRTELIQQQNGFKIKMKELEDGILAKLAAAEGDITEDVELIESLERTKQVAKDIAEKQMIASKTEVIINETAEKYRPVARRAALLFFMMNDLFKVHTYYIYSLEAFITIFLRAIALVSGDNDPYKEEWYGQEEEAPKAAPSAAEESKEGESAAAAAAAGSDDAEEGSSSASDVQLKKGLSDEQLVVRCDVLKKSVTWVTFSYINRGLFVRDKLTIATQLCFKVMLDGGLLDPDLVRMLSVGEVSPDAGHMGALGEWLPPHIWPRIKALERVKPVFEKIGDDMQTDSDAWRAWFDDEACEHRPPPGEYKSTIVGVYKLLLLRAMRPDRLTSALAKFISDNMGEEYVLQKPFNMAACYEQSSPTTPIFFVLFPGVDPTTWVEALGAQLGMTSDAGKFINISMGQGQEKNAMEGLKKFGEEGGWIMLQNVHLMQEWLPSLERQLELISGTAHSDFRCFISAEPPPISYMRNMPESLMQSCIKVANEAPEDLKSNLLRAWANFSEETISQSNKPEVFKACLFTLCFYHAVVLGRRRFGQQGWSKKYSFNVGDLTVCANVLMQYVNDNETTPWQDLRYIFGEIMYGGHITDWWDRRTNNTYLEVYLQPEILSGTELGPGLKVPDMSTVGYDDVELFFEKNLPEESPPMFGLHPNAEIGYLTSSAEALFSTILALSGSSSSEDSGGGKGGGGGGVGATIATLLEGMPENFVMIDIEATAEPLLKEQTAPYVLVAMQECERMNRLLSAMRGTLVELQKGLNGELNMTEAMEHLSEALSINQVPGRNPFHKTSWEALAWPSNKNLTSWNADLQRRVEQMVVWSTDLVTPRSMWLPGLFNPMAFLTAIMQVTARQTGLALDNMSIDTHLSAFVDPSEVEEYPENGMFCHGLFIEGARWATGEEGGDPETIGTTVTQGCLADSRIKELLPTLPVVYLRAVEVQPSWDPQSVGYIRGRSDIYECPVYTTTFRGPTYVFLATLRTREPKSKWVRAGVAIIMQTDD
jgi:dynein heavy chain, axonemal